MPSHSKGIPNASRWPVYLLGGLAAVSVFSAVAFRSLRAESAPAPARGTPLPHPSIEYRSGPAEDHDHAAERRAGTSAAPAAPAERGGGDPPAAGPIRPEAILEAQRKLAEKYATDLKLDEPVRGRFLHDYLEYIGIVVHETNIATYAFETKRAIVKARTAEFEARVAAYLTGEQMAALRKSLWSH